MSIQPAITIMKRNPVISIGVGLFLLGIGPLFLADALRILHFDVLGFGTLWGLTFGPFFICLGLLILFIKAAVALFYYAKATKFGPPS